MMLFSTEERVKEFWCYMLLFSVKLDSISWVYFMLYFGILWYSVFISYVSRLFLIMTELEKLRHVKRWVAEFWRSSWTARVILVGGMSCLILWSCCVPRAAWMGKQCTGTNEPSAGVGNCDGVLDNAGRSGDGKKCTGTCGPSAGVGNCAGVLDNAGRSSDGKQRRGINGPSAGVRNCAGVLDKAGRSGDGKQRSTSKNCPDIADDIIRQQMLACAVGSLGSITSRDQDRLPAQFGSIFNYVLLLGARGSKSIIPVLTYGIGRTSLLAKDNRFLTGAPKILIHSLVLLGLQIPVHGKDLQRYMIEDPQGYETSYLYEGGKLSITCDNDKNKLVAFNTIIDGDLTADPEEKVPFTREIALESSLFLKKYGYLCGHADGKLMIKPFHCDPFLMIPPVTSCKVDEVCLIDNADSTKCGEKVQEDCFLAKFSEMKDSLQTSLPKPRAVCTTKDPNSLQENKDTQYGLCHARAVASKPFEGSTEDFANCNQLRELMFNGESVKEDKLLFTDKNPSAWSIKYDLVAYDKKCIAYDSKKEINAKYEAKNSKDFAKVSGNMPRELPTKLKFHCEVFNDAFNDTWSFSTFLIIYDKNINLYKASIQLKNSTEPNALDLWCKCDIPKGFICTLSWKKPVPNAKPLPYAPLPNPFVRTLYLAKHGSKANYECFMEVFVFNTPVSYDLVRVPSIGVIRSKSLSVSKKDFDTAAVIDNGKINSSRKSEKTNSHEKDNAAKENKSNTTAIVLGVVGFVVVAAIISAIIVLILVFQRRRKSKGIDSSRTLVKEVIKEVVKEVVVKEPVIETDLTLVNLIQKDVDNQVTLQQLVAFEGIKPALIARARELNKERPDYKTAIQEFPDFVIFKTQWETLEREREARRTQTPECVGYLLDTRYPEMPATRATFVHKSFMSRLLSVEPSAAEIAQLSRNPTPLKCLHSNYVKDLDRNDLFILCQAPREKDMIEFFHMILNEGVTLVVTLVRPEELRRQRYYPYFGLRELETKIWGPFSLECLLLVADRRGLFVTRSVRIKYEPEKKSKKPVTVDLKILSYLQWGDFFSPADCGHVSTVVSSIKRITKQNHSKTTAVDNSQLKTPKIIVHCSAGIGRSGALVVSYILMDYIERYNCPISIKSIVNDVRCHRERAVQEFEQYVLLLWVSAEFARSQLGELAPQVKMDVRSQLASTANVSKYTKSSAVPLKSKK